MTEVTRVDSRGFRSPKRTFSLKPAEVVKEWILVDAQNLVLGRLAAFVAMRLRGKHRPDYTPHVDCGDFVVVVNAEKIALTGRKKTQKLYHRHTGYVGGLKSTTPEQILNGNFPERVLEYAIRGMIPGGPLGSRQLRNLKVYCGSSHPHFAQQPVPVDVSELNEKNLRTSGVMAKAPLTTDIIAGVRSALKEDIESAISVATNRIENSFSKELMSVKDEISSLTRNFDYYSKRADAQLDVQEKELEELRKFNANAETYRGEQREEMKKLHEMIAKVADKLDPK